MNAQPHPDLAIPSFHLRGDPPRGAAGIAEAAAAIAVALFLRRLHRHGAGGLVYEDFTLQETQVREYGDTAVVTALIDQPGTHQGNPIPNNTRSTLVLVKQSGKWLITTNHMSFVAGTPGAPPIPNAS